MRSHYHYNQRSPLETTNKRWTGAMIGATVIGAGLSYGLSQIPTGGKGGGQGGAQFVPATSYAGAEKGIGGAWDYVSQGLQSLQEGKPPTWFQNWRPLEEYQRKNALTGQYYGAGAGAQGKSLWGPGILGSQQAADVKAGRRGAGAGSNYAKQLQMYSQGMSDIDTYLSQLGATAMQTAESNYLQSAQRLPAQYQGQVVPFGGQAYQPSGMESVMQGIGSYAPYAFSAAMNRTNPNVVNQFEYLDKNPTGGYADYLANTPAKTATTSPWGYNLP